VLRIGTSFHKSWVAINKQDIFGLLRAWLSADRCDYVVIGELIQIYSNIPLDAQSTETKDIDLFLKLTNYFIVKQQGTTDPNWYFAAGCLVKSIFKLTKRPEVLTQLLLKTLSSFLTGFDRISASDFFGSNNTQRNYLGALSEAVNTQGNAFDNNVDKNFENKLSQVMFVAGEVALALLAEADKVESYLRKLAETHKDKNEEGELEGATGGQDAQIEDQKVALSEIVEKEMIGVIGKSKIMTGIFFWLKID
jgi:hypothetical protein